MHVYVYVCIYISEAMYACMHIYLYMCICIHICIHICIYTSPYSFFAESMHAFTGVVEHHACAGVYVRQML